MTRQDSQLDSALLQHRRDFFVWLHHLGESRRSL